MSEDYIREVFGHGGILSKHFDGYEIREGQLQLAYQVDESFENKTNSLAEAPTGVGKSLGYGVPAVYAVKKAKRTVIVTANIALQEQLVNKDLPLLKKIISHDFSFAIAKGFGNYLCLDNYADAVNDLLLGDFSSPEEQQQWPDVVEWADRTKTGDVSELPFELHYKVRPLVTTSSEDCIGKKCASFGNCHVMAAKRKYSEADIVVTNYHLFFADLSIKARDGQGVLPNYDYVIFDEGHKAADIARDFFGFQLTRRAVRWAARFLSAKGVRTKKSKLPEIDPGLKKAVENLCDQFFDDLSAYYDSDGYHTRLYDEDFVDADLLCEALGRTEKAYLEAAASAAVPVDRKEDLRNAAERCIEVISQIQAAVSLLDDDSRVYFIEKRGQSTVLSMKPIDVSEQLRVALFDNDKVDSIVVTSATLTTGGPKGFKYVSDELGVDMDTTLVADSPFDFESVVQLVIPKNMPQPSHQDFADRVADVALEAARRGGGRMLALFTSYRVLNIAYDRLSASNLPFKVLKQGDMPRSQLIAQFKADETSVLLGTESFWAGIDVPGPALSTLLIDKLPFTSPTDPLFDAVSANDKRAFFTYSIPRAVIQIRQGFGRLIRTKDDKGIVIICDRRILDKPYGKQFLRALPDVPRGNTLEVIGA